MASGKPCGPGCPLCAEPTPDPDPQTPLEALALNNACRRQRAAYHEMMETTVRKSVLRTRTEEL